MHLRCISPQDASLCCPVTLVLFVDPVHPGDGFACTPTWHSNPRRAARARPRRWRLTPCGPRDGTDERTAADELGASGTFTSPMTREELPLRLEVAADVKEQARAFRIERCAALAAFAQEAAAVQPAMAVMACERSSEYLAALPPEEVR